MAPRTCVCGQPLGFDESYGPVSNNLLKWYPNSRSFGEPSVRRKYYLCREHTLEVTNYLEALAEGKQAALVVEAWDS